MKYDNGKHLLAAKRWTVALGGCCFSPHREGDVRPYSKSWASQRAVRCTWCMENTSEHQESSKKGGAKCTKSSLAGQDLLDKLGYYRKLIFEHLFFHYTSGSTLYCSIRIPTPEIQLHGSIPALCCQHRLQASSQSGACWSSSKYWMYAAGWPNFVSLCLLSMSQMTVILFIYNYLMNCEKFCELFLSGLKLKCMVLGHHCPELAGGL